MGFEQGQRVRVLAKAASFFDGAVGTVIGTLTTNLKTQYLDTLVELDPPHNHRIWYQSATELELLPEEAAKETCVNCIFWYREKSRNKLLEIGKCHNPELKALNGKFTKTNASFGCSDFSSRVLNLRDSAKSGPSG